MNRLLILFCCTVACLFSCKQHREAPSTLVLQQSLQMERPDTATMRMLLEAGKAYIMRPGIEREDVDSAILCMKKVFDEAVRTGDKLWEARANLLYSQILREQNDKKGIDYAFKAEAAFKELGERYDLAETYAELAEHFPIDDPEQFRKKLQCFRNAAEIYKELGLKLKQANTLYRLGDFYTLVPDYKEARNILMEAVKVYQEINHKGIHGAYDLIGAIYNQEGDPDNALKYALMAVKIAREVGDDSTSLMSTIYNRLGMIYYRLYDPQNALENYQNAMAIAKKLKDTFTIQVLVGNMAHTYQLMRKPDKAWSFLRQMERDYPPDNIETRAYMYESIITTGCILKKFDEVYKYVQQMEEMRRELPPDDYRLENIITPLTTYYNSVGQFEKAHNYAQDVLAFAKGHQRLSLQVKAYSLLYKIDSALTNYKEALEHFRMYKITNDSLYSITKMRTISRLQVQFDTEQKDQALKLKEQNIALLTREADLQKAQLNSTRLTRNVIVIGAGMLIALLVLGYNRYQLKLRSNRKLEQQQEEINQKNISLQKLIAVQNKLLDEKEWLVKEIHHRVKNNLQIVMSLLNTQAAFLNDKDALNAIRESRYRMQAISLIHQKLYQSENMALIDMHNYIHDLVGYLRDGFSGVSRIKFDLHIAPVKLDVTQAVPIGLILNEAITNAIKYAFTGNGTIIISLQPLGENLLRLVIADNGRGFQEGTLPSKDSSMGMMLMTTLAEQLDGCLQVQGCNGVTIRVDFPYSNKEILTNSAEEEEMADCA